MSTDGSRSVGSATTRLIVLRGDSGSGKTTTALALRERLGAKTALIHQDYFRREVLHNDDTLTRHHDAVRLINVAARQALDLGYDVIPDGIFVLAHYRDSLPRLAEDHRGRSVFFTFDLGLEETLRRHATKGATGFGEDDVRRWYEGWQPLPHVSEQWITAGTSVEQLVEQILHSLALTDRV